MTYRILKTRLFRRQYKRVLRQGKSRQKIEQVINLLAKCEKLPKHHNAHKLKGVFSGYWECHIEPDLLLVYTHYQDVLVLELIAIGSHSELFN